MRNNLLREVQLVQLEILKSIKDICEKEGISYFLDSGTLLGAVRHKGFIPWDDDLDIGMLRYDYNKFISAAPKYIDEFGLIIQDWHSDKSYGQPFLKVRKKGTHYVELFSQHQK